MDSAPSGKRLGRLHAAAEDGLLKHQLNTSFGSSFQVQDWYLYITGDSLTRKKTKLTKELLDLRTELAKTSSQVGLWHLGIRGSVSRWMMLTFQVEIVQDEFAKWARLRRNLDQKLADLDSTSGFLAL